AGIRDRNVTGVQTCALPILVLVAGVDGDRRSLGSRTCIESHSTPSRDQGGSVCRGPPRVRGPRSRRPAGVLAGTIRRHERCGEGGGEGNRAEGRGGGW